LRHILSFFNDERGVENAVYSILMIAIVAIVAILIGTIVLSRSGEIQALSSTPRAQLSGVLTGGPSSGTLLISHESGDPVDLSKVSLAVFNESDTLICTANVTGNSNTLLNPGMQSDPINLNKAITPGQKYTIKVISKQTKQPIGMMVLVAR
jgi:FlaG/FlaF family flagellin (archaellin)